MHILTATDLTADELLILRRISRASFMPFNQVGVHVRTRLLARGLIQKALGGLMATPAGRIAGRVS